MNMESHEIVASVQAGEPAGVEALYFLVRRACWKLLSQRVLSKDLEDAVHDVFLAALVPVQFGRLTNPEALPAYLLSIARRLPHPYSRESGDIPELLRDESADPEREMLTAEREAAVARLLRSLSSRDRQVLTRSILNQEPWRDICRDLALTDTQFRLIKSRARARLIELAQRHFARQSAPRTMAA